MPALADTKTRPAINELDRKLAYASAAHTPQPPEPIVTNDDRVTPELVSRERQQMASAGIRYLSAIIKQLVELRNDEEADEYGVLRATEHAYEGACRLITDAAIVSALHGRPIPRGCASTDSEGGVRIDWMRPAAAVCLIVPSEDDQDASVYHEVAGVCATEPATAETLARWLREIS
jgi:hypothetical protein